MGRELLDSGLRGLGEGSGFWEQLELIVRVSSGAETAKGMLGRYGL